MTQTRQRDALSARRSRSMVCRELADEPQFRKLGNDLSCGAEEPPACLLE